MDFLGFLNENNKPEKVIRFLNGRRVIKRICGGGYKYNPALKRCVKLDPSQMKKLKLAQKKRVRKMKMKMGTILRKREKSMKIRNSRMS